MSKTKEAAKTVEMVRDPMMYPNEPFRADVHELEVENYKTAGFVLKSEANFKTHDELMAEKAAPATPPAPQGNGGQAGDNGQQNSQGGSQGGAGGQAGTGNGWGAPPPAAPQ